MVAQSQSAVITIGDVSIINGDSREILRGLEENSVDSVVVDPPYELDFTRLSTKTWDSTGVAFDTDLWREALRVLKPGGNLAAFGHPKTVHRLAVAVEDAGFELREQIMVWMYGQGQAKGANAQRELQKKYPELTDLGSGFHGNLRPAYEPIVVARKPLDGSIADNWAQWGVGGFNIDATRVPTSESRSRTPGDGEAVTWRIQRGAEKNIDHPGGRWTPNVVLCHHTDCDEATNCTDDCAVQEIKAQGLATRGRGEDVTRFFPVIRYQPKAPKNERPIVDGIEHSTVKPLALMRWLVRLITPEGGTVIDFFAGSGTTVEAAIDEGHPVIAVELDSEYVPLIELRARRAIARR